MTATIHHGDCLDVLRAMPDSSVDAVVCDPPYGLSNTSPDKVTETIVRWAQGDREYVPQGKGFMGASWDAFVPPVAVWDECLRVLKPGGHLVAFAGSRTQDLMGLAIRLAGFDIRENLAWLYGSGFPKSLDVSKAVDKLDAAQERRARALEFTEWMRSNGITSAQVDEITGTNMGGHFLTAASQPAVATADLFDKLRPHLPEVPARIEELVAQRTVESQNFKAREVIDRRTGTHSAVGSGLGGTAVGIPQERVLVDVTKAHTPEAERWQGWGTALKPAHEPIILARKPFPGTVAANTLTWGTGGLNIDATRIGTDPIFIRGGGAKYDADGNKTFLPSKEVNQWRSGRFPANVMLDEGAAPIVDEQSEGASRFFKVVEPDPPFMYAAKAPKKERPRYEDEQGNVIQHPTTKPLSIMKWLVRLTCPPGGTILDPFAGSGTTIEAAMLEGFNVIGIEREAEYLPLIQQRIDRAQDVLPMAS